jgi:hypothetical protein
MDKFKLSKEGDGYFIIRVNEKDEIVSHVMKIDEQTRDCAYGFEQILNEIYQSSYLEGYEKAIKDLQEKD